MTTEQKSTLIQAIIAHLRFEASRLDKAFSDGEVFLSLCFKSDEELEHIAKLAGL